MKKIVYDTTTGEITAVYGPKVNLGPVGAGEASIVVSHAEIGRHYVDLTTGDLIRRKTSELPASWEKIKAKRNALEVSPITLDSGLTFDYDQQAKLRFETALAQFDNLPTLVDGKLNWKLADNSYQAFSKIELQAVFDELQQKTAIRAAQLFVKGEELAATSLTLGELEDLTTWGI